MPDLTVDADLLVEAGGTDRQLSVDDFKASATGAATQTTAAAILAALTDGDEAVSLAALVAIRDAVEDLASDDDGVSREATALAILAKLGSVTLDAATLAALETIQVGNLPADPATQTTLAAVLAELGQQLEPGDLATLATTGRQDSIIAGLSAIDGHVDGLEGKDFATQATLAAVLAKIVAAPATEAKQDTGNTSLVSILGAVDGLEGFIDTLEAKLQAIADNTDTLEATLTDVDLNTDEIEQNLTDIFTELLGKLEAGDVTGLATAAKQDTLIGHVDGVEGSLAAVLAKLIVAPATEAKQDTLLTRIPAALDGDGALKVADVFTGGEALPDQTGNGTAQTFTFASAVDLVWVRSAVAARADPFGGVPTASQGVPCAADEPNPMTVRTAVVRVIAASGTISVWGYRG